MNTQPAKFFAAMQPRERRATAIVTTIAMMRLFALFALLPVMALFAGSLPGATPTLIGVAVGGYGLTQALLQIPLGALSDRVGRVPVVLLGLAIFASGSILAASSETIYGVIAGRLLQGAGAVSATLTALLADATRTEIRTRTMALLGIGIGSTFLLALVAGPAIAAASGVRSLFWLGACLAFVAAFMLRFLPEGIGPKGNVPVAPLRAALKLPLMRLDLCIFVLHALLSASFVALPFLLRGAADVPVADHWKIYAAALIVSLAGTLPLILADERRGKAHTVTIAVLLLLLGQLLLAFGGVAALPVIAGLALFFAGFNFLEAGLPARLSILADDHVRGASLGVFSSAQFLGIFAGGLTGGWLLDGRPPANVFLFCSVVCGLWLVAQRLTALGNDDRLQPSNKA
ncbi:MAG: MFS transporter [Woeseia sp.]